MKTILITGASSGLGLTTTKYLCDLGFHVYAAIRDIKGRNLEKVNNLIHYASNTKGKITPLEMDLASEESIHSCVQSLEKLSPQLDVLINNAGLGALGLVEELSLAQSKKLFDVNFFAPVELIKQCIPILKQSKTPKVINITSAGGRLNFPLLGYYCASKYAFEAISESLAIELADLNITTHIVEPGSFATNLHGNRIENDNQCYTNYIQMEQIKNNMLNGIAAATGDNQKNRDPLEFSNLIVKLINEDIKQLRHVVGSVATEGLNEINKFTLKHQNNVLKKFGL